MAEGVRPDVSSAYGTEKIIWCPTDTASVATLTGGTALDVTNMWFKSSARPSASTNMVESPERVGDVETYEFIGKTMKTWGEVRYSYGPQAADASDEVIASETLEEGLAGFIYIRRGLPQGTDLATGQFVTKYPVSLGPQTEVPEGDGEGAEWAIVQPIAQTGPETKRVVLTT